MATATSPSHTLSADRDSSRALARLSALLLFRSDPSRKALANLPRRRRSKLNELKSPRHFYHSHLFTSRRWRPASSVYSRNDTVSPLSPDFAKAAASNNDNFVSPLSPDFAKAAASNNDNFVSPLSPDFANVAASNIYRSAAAEVSPPSSPDMEVHRDGTTALTQGRNVSPMDSPNLSQLDVAAEHGRPGQHQHHHHQQPNPEPQQKTNIPMMRRERRKNQDAAAHTIRETKSQQRLRIQRATRWDDMTGEPTSQHTGRAGQVRPQEYAQEFGANQPFGMSPAAMKAMQNAPQTHQSFGDRLRRLRPSGGNQKKQQQQQQQQQQPPPPPPESSATAVEPIDERPPWRGASGRTPIVTPVRDTKPASPLSIPPQGTRRAAAVGPRLPIAGVTSPLSPVSPSRSETSPRSRTPTARTVLNAPRQLTASTASPSATRTRSPPAQSSYPSPPDSGADMHSPAHATLDAAIIDPNAAATLQPAPLPGQPTAPIAHFGHDRAIRRKPPPMSSLALRAPQLSCTSSIYSDLTVQSPTSHERSSLVSPSPADRDAAAAAAAASAANETAAGQPPSTSSPTTPAAASSQATPRQPADTASAPPQSLPTPPHQPDGVMSRKRPPVIKSTSPSINPDKPFVISMSSPYMSGAFAEELAPPPARSQLPSQRDSLPRTSSASLFSNSSRPDSVWSTSKALPPPPTEISMTNDRVGYLKARLESLGNRRININKAIRQMTELMPTDHILASEAVLLKRDAEKRKVEALKMELSEIQREEYETGLKLHRAYKRMDRNAEYEPTTLWVRRVTN